MKNSCHTIAAGEFKAKCLQLMEDVKEKNACFTITKRGKPIAQLIPMEDKPLNLFGALEDSVTINADIISGIDERWEADKDD